MNLLGSTWYLDDAKIRPDRPCNDKGKTTSEVLVSRGYDQRIEMTRSLTVASRHWTGAVDERYDTSHTAVATHFEL